MNVCVFCASSERIDERHKALAALVGTQLGRRGHTLISGGGSVSSMGAVARAARSAGARTIGVVPRALVDLEVADHDADELVVVDTMRQRKAQMDARADAFLVLAGGLGTLEELFEIWVARTLGMTDKPLVILDPDGVYEGLRSMVDGLATAGFVREEAVAAAVWAPSVRAAFAALEGRPAHVAGDPAELLEAEL